MSHEEILTLVKQLISEKIESLPSHYDDEVKEMIYDDISEVDKWLKVNKEISKWGKENE